MLIISTSLAYLTTDTSVMIAGSINDILKCNGDTYLWLFLAHLVQGWLFLKESKVDPCIVKSWKHDSKDRKYDAENWPYVTASLSFHAPESTLTLREPILNLLD